MISPSSIEQLKTTLDVVDVVSNYIELKKNGANFKAPCPFHSEETPSFVVSPAKQIYHCFGCGAGGDAIKFVMEYEKLSYPEAIEKLASDYNVRLEYTQNSKPKIETKVLEDVHHWYQKLLESHQEALRYLKERGVYESSIEKFGLGYAPSSQETMSFLHTTHANMQEALELGLIGFDSGRYFARFIERIVFPIFAQNGKIVGFGGRTITGHQAKYVNSPQTKLFNKSKILYAYNVARDTIYRQKSMIVTEGYLDVVMLHQAGFTNAVATLGTALTREHIPLLKKGEPKIIMAYDGDSAGINAALKASMMLSSAGLDGGVVIFKEGMDPADMVKNDRLDELKQLFSQPKKMPEFTLETLIAKYDLSDPRAKEQAMHECSAYLKTLSPIMQEEYKTLLAALLRISSGHIRLKPESNRPNPVRQSLGQERDIWELSLIKSIIETPALLPTIMDYVEAKMFWRHYQEFELVLQERFEEPRLLAIALDESIKSFDAQNIKEELRIFLQNYYQKAFKHISARTDIDFNSKVKQIRYIKNKIAELKQGKLSSL